MKTILEHAYGDRPRRKLKFLALLQLRALGGGTRGPSSRPKTPLLLPCGPSTIRFCPPLCLTRRQVQIGLGLFEDALAAVDEERCLPMN